MVDQLGRSFRLPDFQPGEQISGDLAGLDPNAAISPAIGELGRMAQGFGQVVQDLAEKSAAKDGQRAAAADAAAGKVQLRSDNTAFGQSYNQLARRSMSVQRKAALSETMGQAFVDNSDNPTELGKALDAARGGMENTGDPEVDAELNDYFAVERAGYMTRAIEGAKAAIRAQGQAAYLTDRETQQGQLDRVAANAPFDDNGAQLVGAAYVNTIRALSKWGPKTAFDVGGVHFDADPNRADAVSPAEIAAQAVAANKQARSSWILNAAAALPDAEAKRKFAADLHERWKAGDPAFSAFDEGDIVKLGAQLEGDANRTETDANAARTQAAQQTRNMIEAMQWGADVDTAALLQAAHGSGDPGLVAQAELYASTPAASRAVLRKQAEEMMGLTPDPDAWFHGPGATAAPRGLRNNNPGNVKALPNGQLWAGQTGVDANGYAVFGSRDAGMEAARTNLRSYGKKGIDTVSSIVRTWAPAEDGNDTAAYIADVSRQLGVKPDQKLDLTDEATLTRLSYAIARHENGAAFDHAGGAAGPPEAFVNDPIGYARGTTNRPPLVSVPGLGLDDAFGDDPRGWVQAMQARQAVGAELAKASGRSPRLLDNSERAYYSDIIKSDPDKTMKLALAARQALGAAGANRFFREIGGAGEGVNTALHIADLAAGGSYPFAASAAEGIKLRAEGRTLDKAAVDDLKANFDRVAKAALAQVPDVYAPALNAATAAMLSDQAHGTHHSMEYYVQSALGGSTHNGVRYGGAVSVNRQITIIPRWLAPDYLDDAMKAFGEHWVQSGIAPVYANGKQMDPAYIARLRPVLTPSGKYALVNPDSGRPVAAKNGNMFLVDFDAGRVFLRAKFGTAAVRPGN